MTTGAIKESNLKDKPGVMTEAELQAALLGHKQLLFNRELSWIEFNRRVLEEALDKTHPLLERLKFLSIFSTNLDEFFMIRVSGLQEALEENVVKASPDGLTPAEQLKEISVRLRPLVAEQTRCLLEEILPELKAHGIAITPYSELSEEERQVATRYFMENVFPVLTPQAVDPGHPFPYISNRSLNLGLMVELPDDPDVSVLSPHFSPGLRFARIKLPPTVPRLVPVNEAQSKFTFLGSIISANTGVLFPGMQTGRSYLFRVTRDGDMEIRDDQAADLMRLMEQHMHRLRFGHAVRLEVSSAMPVEMVEYLRKSLDLTPDDVYVIDGPMNIPDMMMFCDLNQPKLRDQPLQPSIPAPFAQSSSFFEVIKEQDVLLHHPYTSYAAVTDFINAAANDPDVLAIKICLYRTGQRSPIVKALMEASERGKQVAALVELKARFDEGNNIEWARQLERAGVHVVYGLLGLKTHCKVMLVVRREGDKLQRYVHIATGNYNPTTSRIYTDLGLFTANAEIGADATDLFNFLTGYSRQSRYRQLLVAPISLREQMTSLINRETAHAKDGRPARIIVKINSLTDTDIIRTLYKASHAGVRIDLIVRGICMLRPGVPGLSEMISVRSIVGRFLEHSRIFYFANGGDKDIYIGSADWMHRNLDHRVEVVTPIHDQLLKKKLKDILDAYLRDNVKARTLLPDGSYERVRPVGDETGFSSQAYFGSSNSVHS